LPKVKEADITGMVPTTSTTITLLLGDCLATTVMRQRKFSKEKFKVFHPGGNIGSSLLLAKDIMVKGKKMPTINYKKGFKEALKVMNQKKLGIVVILNKNYIAGLVTDGDLRREIKNYSNNQNLNNFMRKSPLVVNESMPAAKALAIMNEKKITSLLVVQNKNFIKKNKKLIGIIHIHSLLENGIK
jgi:arabinose-5-phosphate isomerase